MKALPKKKKMVNHVVFLLDASGSMATRTLGVRAVMRDQLANLVKEGKKIDTRVHVYSFGYGLQAHVTNVRPEDVSYSYSHRNEGTALIDSALELIDRLEVFTSDSKTDSSILVYILTDGQETEHRSGASRLRTRLNGLNDDWTMAILVPDENCQAQAVEFGFPPDNIQIWDVTTERGIGAGGQAVSCSTQSYYTMRSLGQKSTKCLFKLDDVTKTDVRKKLDVVDPGEYDTLIVRPYYDGWAIKDFVEGQTKKPYRVGSAYYQLSKPETIQGRKSIAVVEKSTGKMYSGDNARKLLGLPNYDVKVGDSELTKFDVFVQSTSTNRKLVGNTFLVLFK